MIYLLGIQFETELVRYDCGSCYPVGKIAKKKTIWRSAFLLI